MTEWGWTWFGIECSLVVGWAAGLLVFVWQLAWEMGISLYQHYRAELEWKRSVIQRLRGKD